MASVREIRPGSWRVEWREDGRGSKKHYRFFKTEEEARAYAADPTGMGIGPVGTRIGLPSVIADLSSDSVQSRALCGTRFRRFGQDLTGSGS